MIIPIVIAAILLFGFIKKVNVFEAFIDGATEGAKLAVHILPAIIALMVCIGMFKASGGLDILTQLMTPILAPLGIPAPVIPLTLLRPLSGSGALVIIKDILSTYGANSHTGRIASVMQGSTETTFYTIAMYFGATKATSTKYALICALFADFVGFILSVITVNLFF